MSCASKTREIAHPIARLALILTKPRSLGQK
jgi:hypothetical protein